MPLQLGKRTAVLIGAVTVDDAEPLASWLRTTTEARVDLTDCDHLHTAALQALLAGRVRVLAPPADAFLRAWVLPLLGTVPGVPHETADVGTAPGRVPLEDTAPTTEEVAP